MLMSMARETNPKQQTNCLSDTCCEAKRTACIKILSVAAIAVVVAVVVAVVAVSVVACC